MGVWKRCPIIVTLQIFDIIFIAQLFSYFKISLDLGDYLFIGAKFYFGEHFFDFWDQTRISEDKFSEYRWMCKQFKKILQSISLTFMTFCISRLWARTATTLHRAFSYSNIYERYVQQVPLIYFWFHLSRSTLFYCQNDFVDLIIFSFVTPHASHNTPFSDEHWVHCFRCLHGLR